MLEGHSSHTVLNQKNNAPNIVEELFDCIYTYELKRKANIFAPCMQHPLHDTPMHA